MTAIIVDTSAVLASLNEAYAEHQAAAEVIAAVGCTPVRGRPCRGA